MLPSHAGFRPGNVLATNFTGTLSERHGDAKERIPTPGRLTGRLTDWLALQGLDVESCTHEQLHDAWTLREAIHDVATATAAGLDLPDCSVIIINDYSSTGRASVVLTSHGAWRWKLSAARGMEDALGVIANDAIMVIAGGRDGILALCASPTCRAAFLDTSRGRTRRWCDMNTCGNRQKKAHYRRASKTNPAFPTERAVE